MKLTIERSHLLKALSHVQSVVERRTTIPILSNVLIDASRSGVRLSATDLDLEMVEDTNAAVEVEGAITAPAHTLYEIVRKLPDGSELSLEANTDESRLTVLAGKSQFALPILPADDFPTLSSDGLSCQFSLSAHDLARLIDRTKFAVSTEETRYYLNGIYLHAVQEGDGHLLRAVATDGHRLALADVACPQGAEELSGVIIPRKTVAEARRLLEDVDGDVQIAASSQKIRFEFGNAILTSKVIDGSFPDYLRVIPANNDQMMTAENALFAKAVDRVATISSDKARSVKMSLEEDRLVLSVRNADAGLAVEELSIEYKGTPIEIGFNAKYLTDICNEIQGDTATFALADAASPTLVTDTKDDQVRYVLMPLRV